VADKASRHDGYWSQSLDDLLGALECTADGLSTDEARQRLTRYGQNTGWFVESVLSASLVIFVLRSRLPFLHSLPSRSMLAVAGLVAAATLASPYSPLAALIGFEPLPWPYLVVVLVIVAAYLASAEWVKRWFYRWASG